MIDYEGSDLDAMAGAVNYRRWVFDDIRRFVGRKILEVGAGVGSFSELLLEADPERFVALEPSSRQHKVLEERLTSFRQTGRGDARLEAVEGTTTGIAGALGESSFDTVAYLNVLEHIEDDVSELRLVRRMLEPAGHLIIYVPALPSLYGPFDKRIGHFRRYTRKSLSSVVQDAGFEVKFSEYRDLAGVIPWWVSAKILRSDSLRPAAVRIYDRIIPAVRMVDRITGPPVGKNLLLVAGPHGESTIQT